MSDLVNHPESVPECVEKWLEVHRNACDHCLSLTEQNSARVRDIAASAGLDLSDRKVRHGIIWTLTYLHHIAAGRQWPMPVAASVLLSSIVEIEAVNPE